MSFITHHFDLIMIGVVAITWAFILLTMIKLKIKYGLNKQNEYEVDHLAFFGYALQIVSFVFLLLQVRFDFSQSIIEQIDFAEDHKNPTHFAVISGITLSLSILSSWMICNAMNSLDKFWTFKSGMFRDHRFISEGPYQFVRHPIYTGYLGMLIATGLSITNIQTTIIAITIYMIGTY